MNPQACEDKQFSGNTWRCLDAANWSTGRAVDPEDYLRILDDCGGSTCAAVSEFLAEFGGLEMVIPRQKSGGVVDLNFGVWPGLRDTLRVNPQFFSKVNAVVGSRTASVGDMEGELLELYMDERNRLYQVLDLGVWYVGNAGMHAIENLCMRASTPEMRRPIEERQFVPPGCPNARWLAARAEVQFGEPIENDPMTSPQATPAEIVHPEDQEWIHHRPTLDDMERAGVHVHRAARRFLDRYSGIRIVHRNPHLKHYVSWGYLGLSRSSLCCLESRYLPALQERRKRWGWPVVVGMIDDFNLELVVNERGDIMISKFHEPEWLLGRSPDAAIDTLLNQRPWEPLRR